MNKPYTNGNEAASKDVSDLIRLAHASGIKAAGTASPDISIELTKEIYTKLQQKAKQENCSMEALVAKYLSEIL